MAGPSEAGRNGESWPFSDVFVSCKITLENCETPVSARFATPLASLSRTSASELFS
ncbi:hypothetical protein [Candidatus Njordibacter sp. Uisw_058]|uniref:hypothetical protein n=1 Tax=Candidatus Njordibacter sp. Uisw_058 TaxID=3230974 RepID=UPI003D37586C